MLGRLWLRGLTHQTNKCSWVRESRIRRSIMFEYGNSSFAAVCRPGVFHVDRTNYIPLIEHAGRVLTFLRPRRMGKSFVISMLQHYYDVRYREQFKDLFGHLHIGNQPTNEHNSYLVLQLDFSYLNTNSVEQFEQSLNDTINRAIINFKLAYPFLENIDINKSNAIDSFVSLCGVVALSEYAGKLYILIDEYDNSVNKALSDVKSMLHNHLYIRPDEDAMNKLKQEQNMKGSSYRTFFSAIKSHVGKSIGRVFITGVSPIALNDFTSGFNIAKHITHNPRFAELCGITREELKLGLSGDIEKHLQVMEENYDGLMFHPDQKNRLFNTTLAIHYMSYLQEHGVAPQNYDLIDPNIQPSESVFTVISQSPLCGAVLTRILQQENVYIEEPITRTIAVKNMMKLIAESETYVMSLMYYMGALTQGKLPIGKSTGAVLRVPNLIARKEFLDALGIRVADSNSISEEAQIAVTRLLKTKDIAPMCIYLQKQFSSLKGNAVLFQNESHVQEAIKHAFNWYGKKIVGGDEFEFEDIDGTTIYSDLLYGSEDKIHIELKNIKPINILLKKKNKLDYFDGETDGHKSWSVGIRICKEVYAMKNDDLMQVETRESSTTKNIYSASANGNILRKDLKTVKDVLDNLVAQTKRNKAGIEKKVGKPITSFAVLRVGLYKLLWIKLQ